MNLLSVNHLSIGYQNVLQDKINFTVNSGDLLCINGHNGKGKTTLLKTLLGTQERLGGDIKYNISLSEIAYLPQLISHDIPLSLTLGEILESFAGTGNLRDILNPELLSRRWVDSSGGEKQKILIGTQLKSQHKILLLDEPFNHIDKESVDNLLMYFRKIIDDQFIDAIVFISHISTSLMEELNVKTLELA